MVDAKWALGVTKKYSAAAACVPNSCADASRAYSVTPWPYEESSERKAILSWFGFRLKRGARCLAMNSMLYQPKPVASISVRKTVARPRLLNRGSTQEVSQ